MSSLTYHYLFIELDALRSSDISTTLGQNSMHSFRCAKQDANIFTMLMNPIILEQDQSLTRGPNHVRPLQRPPLSISSTLPNRLCDGPRNLKRSEPRIPKTVGKPTPIIILQIRTQRLTGCNKARPDHVYIMTSCLGGDQ